MTTAKHVITDCNIVDLPLYKAYGEEIHMFMHIHLRGYDKDGNGKQMHAEYYDKYGAPMKLEDSWLEGYRAVEKEIANHYNKCVNPRMPFPIPAASAGGCHLYEDIHYQKPWNWTGFVPAASKWCCYDKFFPNRHFVSLRGNEIQNNLWNYHPHDEDPSSPDWDDKYKQLIPKDQYRGGYFFFNNPWGRYLHLITLKSMHPEPDFCKRYNYIVHPLAYRASVPDLPDDSVDAMQWSIIKINSRTLNLIPKGRSKQPNEAFPAFGDDQLHRWGERCHGLEIFNDFTYYYSSTPLNDGDDWKGGNGYLHDGRNPDYIHWFNSYPHEMGEFLFETSLRHGTYIHALSANDAMYQRADIEVQFADPKAPQTTSLNENFKKQRLGELKRKQKESADATKGVEKEKEAREFLAEMPYQEDTVFGYTTLIDPDLSIRKKVYGDEPFNIHPKIDEGELEILDFLIEGRFYSHTGVYDIFNFKDSNGDIQQHCPIMMDNQDSRRFNYHYQPELHEMIFTLPRAKKPCPEIPHDKKSIQDDIVWQITFEVVKEATKSVECHRAYFKLSEDHRTRLDFTKHINENEVAWIRIQGYDIKNPHRRAWFQAIKGPMFNKIDWSKEYGKVSPNPRLTNIVWNMESLNVSKNNEIFNSYSPSSIFENYARAKDDSLVFDFNKTTNEDYLCVYNLQVHSLKQNNALTVHKTLPPTYRQNVCGVFQLSEIYPTKLDLNSSWDKDTVENNTCLFYKVNEKAQVIAEKELIILKT